MNGVSKGCISNTDEQGMFEYTLFKLNAIVWKKYKDVQQQLNWKVTEVPLKSVLLTLIKFSTSSYTWINRSDSSDSGGLDVLGSYILRTVLWLRYGATFQKN